jgi:ankyrin repeat protein
MVDALVKAGADKDLMDHDGNTPLDLAIFDEAQELVRSLGGTLEKSDSPMKE